MLKNFFILLIIIIFTGCEYKPIYSNSNKTNYKIFVTDLTGDKKLNKFLVENIIRNSQKILMKLLGLRSTQNTQKIF